MNKKVFKAIWIAALVMYLLLVIAIGSCQSQTILKDIPIQSEYPYLVKVWAFNSKINAWDWYEITETGHPGTYEWYLEKEISCEVDQYDVLDIMFIRGFEGCGDTTRVKVYGSYGKEIIKDSKDFRKVLKLAGLEHSFGTEIKRPS